MEDGEVFLLPLVRQPEDDDNKGTIEWAKPGIVLLGPFQNAIEAKKWIEKQPKSEKNITRAYLMLSGQRLIVV